MSAATRWMTAALCTAVPGLPWTTDTDRTTPAQRSAMRRICAACPVLTDCAGYADSAGMTGGWWAGIDRDLALTEAGQLVLGFDVLGGAA